MRLGISYQSCPIPKSELKDYKLFCFNGEPQFLKVNFNRFVEHHANYYDLNMAPLDFAETVCMPDKRICHRKPSNFEDMIEIARKLSKDIPFVRVDLYNNNGSILFGELTLYPAAAFGSFVDMLTDYRIGKMLQLPNS